MRALHLYVARITCVYAWITTEPQARLVGANSGYRVNAVVMDSPSSCQALFSFKGKPSSSRLSLLR